MAGLRVGVRGGGCSGFQYQLAFDEQRESDVVFESHGLKLLVDGESLQFVRGSTIDYEESLQGAGFKVDNPNVVAACGCGSSFRVAEEEQVSRGLTDCPVRARTGWWAAVGSSHGDPAPRAPQLDARAGA